MSSTKGNTVSSSASKECKNHAQKIRQDLSLLSKSLQKKGEKLHSYNGIATQTKFLDATDAEKLLNSWERIFGQVAELDFEIRHFVEDKTPVTVVVAGGFSAGKSTFLNGLLGIDLLEIADGPASKRIVSIKYGSVESYYEVTSPVDKAESPQKRQILKEDLRKLQLDDKNTSNNPVSELEIYLNSETLLAMTLVDTPGLQAVGKKGGDTEGTIAAVKTKADILFWLVDASRGSIPAEDVKELKMFVGMVDHPMIILNQIDKLAPNERKAFKDKVCKQLNGLFGKGKHTLFLYSAKVIFDNRSPETKRQEAISQLAEGFAEALESGSHMVEKLGSENSILIAGFQGPLVSAIDMASEADAKTKVSDPELLRKKEEVLSLMNDIIKDRPNLMLKYNLKISQLHKDIGFLDKSITKLKKRLDKAFTDERERIYNLFERGTEKFEKNIKKVYTELNEGIIHSFSSTKIEDIHVRETGFLRSFKGEVRIRFDFKPNEFINGKIKEITSAAQRLTEVFNDYGVGADILDKFERSVQILVDALLCEALKDLKSLCSLSNPSAGKSISIETNADNHQFFLELIPQYLKILVTNDVLWEFCDSAFLQEMRRSVERYFANIEKIIDS